MSESDIQATQDLLLHDLGYLQDKSVKKVSVATLKRRQQQISQPTANPAQKDDYQNVKPSASLLELKNKFKQQKQQAH